MKNLLFKIFGNILKYKIFDFIFMLFFGLILFYFLFVFFFSLNFYINYYFLQDLMTVDGFYLDINASDKMYLASENINPGGSSNKINPKDFVNITTAKGITKGEAFDI
jgi:hypothetical protein